MSGIPFADRIGCAIHFAMRPLVSCFLCKADEMQFPVVEHADIHSDPRPPAEAEALAERLVEEHTELRVPDEFRPLMPDRLESKPTLHLDDLSEITRLDPGDDVRFYQDRAVLRAGDLDFVATCADCVAGHEDYCRETLGLGTPEWIRPRRPQNPLRIAEACYEDAGVRQYLVDRIRQGELTYLHPHMGTLAVWELAALLSEDAGRPLRVIAPPPRLSRWVNNKVAFAEVVRRMFGTDSIPKTESAWNLSMLAARVRELAEESTSLCLKLPDAAGGGGNVLLNTARLRGRNLSDIEHIIRQAVRRIEWNGERELLVDVWESNVICAPSVQLWIPPEDENEPVVEGIFEQVLEGDGAFTGTVPAALPEDVAGEIANRCWLLGRLFQRLGYIGRCSFDLILVGRDITECRPEFIECNGRWGGTSIPMMLMNRLFGDWKSQPFAVRVFHHIAGLERISFPGLLSRFESDLFEIRTGSGSLIFYNPGRLHYQSGISVIALADTVENAVARLRDDVEPVLRSLANTPAPCRSSI